MISDERKKKTKNISIINDPIKEDIERNDGC